MTSLTGQEAAEEKGGVTRERGESGRKIEKGEKRLKCQVPVGG